MLAVLFDAAICTLVFSGSCSGTVNVVGIESDWAIRKALAGFDTPTKVSSIANVITELCCLCSIPGLSYI